MPRLAALLPAALIALATVAEAQQVPDLTPLRDRALDLVNRDRTDNGLPPLQPGELLDTSALAHATDMAKRDYYAHRSPEGKGPRDRYLAEGGSPWDVVAENIARCTGCPTPPGEDRVKALEDGWMNSPEHRANILAEGLTRFGYAIVTDGNVTYAVQTFAGPGHSQGKDRSAITPEQATQLALERINAARKDAGAPALDRAPALSEAAARLIPDDLNKQGLDQIGDVGAALPDESRGDWRQLMAVGAECGGCGTEVVRGDIDAFLSGWLAKDGPNRARLLDPQMTGLGLSLKAGGQGHKVAVLLLGQAR